MSVSITSACRDISELNPVAQKACKLFMEECKKAGLGIFITETYRSQARQDYLYAQGRTRPGNKVTWTLKSNHTGRMAWDIAVNPPKSLYDTATLKKAGAIAKNLGITWGGDWKGTPDQPHFEVKSNWQAPKKNQTANVKEEPKVATTRDINKVSDWADKDWKEATANGYYDGSRPGATLTREESSIVVNRLRKNFLKLIGGNTEEIKKLETKLKEIEKNNFI
ncbi:MAG: M15 family metallopeptidase [Heyndrickxia oleronia]|jgi:peptidoglycan L-alanyl-D-glutamate endopeptidase CwlK|nr:M15 family metallopeptidase [Heyndrickxia oleronia]